MPELRSLPTSSELTQPFWDAAARGSLVRPYCPACDASFFTPQLCCPRCLGLDWEWAESTGRGTVESFSVCHRGPDPSFEVPYVLAIVALEEGWSMLSNIVGCPPEAVEIDMPVRVHFEAAGGGVLPVFEPAETR